MGFNLLQNTDKNFKKTLCTFINVIPKWLAKNVTLIIVIVIICKHKYKKVKYHQNIKYYPFHEICRLYIKTRKEVCPHTW